MRCGHERERIFWVVIDTSTSSKSCIKPPRLSKINFRAQEFLGAKTYPLAELWRKVFLVDWRRREEDSNVWKCPMLYPRWCQGGSYQTVVSGPDEKDVRLRSNKCVWAPLIMMRSAHAARRRGCRKCLEGGLTNSGTFLLPTVGWILI